MLANNLLWRHAEQVTCSGLYIKASPEQQKETSANLDLKGSQYRSQDRQQQAGYCRLSCRQTEESSDDEEEP